MNPESFIPLTINTIIAVEIDGEYLRRTIEDINWIIDLESYHEVILLPIAKAVLIINRN